MARKKTQKGRRAVKSDSAATSATRSDAAEVSETIGRAARGAAAPEAERDDPTSAPSRALGAPVLELWSRYVVAGVVEEERASLESLNARERVFDWRPMAVLIFAVIMLALQEYFGKQRYFLTEVAPQYAAEPYAPRAQRAQLFYWAQWCVLTYLILPALFTWIVLRRRLRDYGLTFKGTLKHMWFYVLMFCVVVPLIFFVADDPHFQAQYPFFRAAATDPVGFWLWEIAYIAQFFSLEFFFRGFMVHGLKERFGAYAVVIMTIPYCMIHFGKPFPETMGSIIAGLALGYLALRTGSVILGFLIHVSVALTMDFVSLSKRDELAGVFDVFFR